MTDDQQTIERLKARLERERRARIAAEQAAERVADSGYARQQELELMERVAKAANRATTVEAAIGEALTAISEHLGWPVGHFYAVDEERNLRPTGSWHLADPARYRPFAEATDSSWFRPGEGLPGQVLAEGQPVWFEDITKLDDFHRSSVARQVGLRAAVGIPALSEDKVLGVVEVFAPTVRRRDPNTMQLASYVAEQVGRTLERERTSAELERQVAERTATLQTLTEDMQMIGIALAHDLRAPTRAVSSYATLLAEKARGLDEQGLEYIERIEESGRRVWSLLDDVLVLINLSRRPIDAKTVSIRREADRAIATLAEGADRIHNEIPDELQLDIDPVMLRGALERLLDNALIATQSVTTPHVEIRGEVDGDRASIVVADNGPGIDLRYADKLFRPFSRLQRPGTGGNGIGLAYVAQVARRFGGEVDAANASKGGAEVTVRLPLAA